MSKIRKERKIPDDSEQKVEHPTDPKTSDCSYFIFLSYLLRLKYQIEKNINRNKKQHNLSATTGVSD